MGIHPFYLPAGGQIRVLKLLELRQHRIGLGLVARAVYIFWALACLGLGWLTLQGYDFFHSSGIEREAITGVFFLVFLSGVWFIYDQDLSVSALVIWVLACFVLGWLSLQGYDFFVSSDIGPGGIKWVFFLVFLGGLPLLYALIWGVSAFFESDTIEKWIKHGGGGSARWSGVLGFGRCSWSQCTKAPIYLGRTLHKYDPLPFCRKIGVDDENHLVTIAQSGAGKSTTAIWPNLVEHAYPDSVFVLDPKGEHAIMTGKHRTAQGQRVYVLDPFNVTKGKVKTHFFNPLAEIDPASSGGERRY